MIEKPRSINRPSIKTDQHDADVQAMRKLARQMLALKLRLLAKPGPSQVQAKSLTSGLFSTSFFGTRVNL